MSDYKKEYDKQYWYQYASKGISSRTPVEKAAIARTKYRKHLAKTGIMDRSLLMS